MLVHEFDNLMERVPFQPFRMYMADGRMIRVKSPRLGWHPPADRTVFIASGGPKSRTHIIDLHLVTRFTVAGQKGDSSNGKPKRRPPR